MSSEFALCHLSCLCRGGGTYLQLGGGKIYYTLPEAVHRGIEGIVLISPREVWKIFSPSFFSYQDGLVWHLRAFALQIPDVRGLQVLGPPCASFLLKFRSRT